jgi:twinkle protein
VKHGGAILYECYERAEPYPVQGIISAESLTAYVHSLYTTGFKEGESTGWASVDELYKVRSGEFTVVTGIPGHGKGTVLNQLYLNLAMSAGWSFALFSPENQPLQHFCARLAETYARKPFAAGYSDRLSEKELSQSMQFIDEHFRFLQPPDGVVTVDRLLELAKVAVYRYGVKGVSFDPWNRIDHSRPSGMSETEFVSNSLAKMTQFAKSYDVHFWLVAHPTKMQKVLEKNGKLGKYPVPTLYDCSGGAHFYNMADCGFSIWRNVKADNCVVEWHNQKVRFKEVGKIGVARLRYEKLTNNIHDDLDQETRNGKQEQEKVQAYQGSLPYADDDDVPF